ncbi:hypothetical protein DVJ83_08350 [Deinococcus wulumuqiensis]|uniref:Uncharacterized protein n=1 Tax=Deinococcus wulumuqiensis TaxID=980427 RepID=A0A345IHJ7_9DEIO|nr:hypothetical protein [Deinococcus wulumuqiensis]AXG99169.1 hypothetical protein DVJ83_08350 [Deinococcus wulumuqiensis]
MSAPLLFLVGLVLAGILLPSAPARPAPARPVPPLPAVGLKVWTRRRFKTWPTAQRGVFAPHPAAGVSGRAFPVTPDNMAEVLSVSAERVCLRVHCDPLAGWWPPVQVEMSPQEFARLYGEHPLTLRSLP